MPQMTPLKLARIKQNRLQVAVAATAGIDVTRLNRIENGWVAPKPDEIERIAAALGVTVKSLTPSSSPP